MTRRYSYSHVAMLKASIEVFTNFKKYVSDFLSVNINLNEAYAEQMLQEIDDLFTVIGYDNTSAQTESKMLLQNLQASIRRTLNLVMSSAGLGFMRTPEKMLILEKPLDSTRLLKSDSDEATMELALNIIGSIASQRALYTQAGVTETLLNDLLTASTGFSEAFKQQSSVTRRASSVSPESQARLDAVYAAAISLSQLAQILFRGERAKLKLFTFSTIAKNYRVGTRKRKAQVSTETTLPSNDFAQSIAEAIAPIIEDKVEQELLIVNGH